MGTFSTAVFIRNGKQMTKEEFAEEFCKSMEKRGYKRATEKSGSKYALAFSEGSDWVMLRRTAYGDGGFTHAEDAGWFSEAMQTHCVSAELVDSDFAVLELYSRSKEQTDMAVLGDASGYWGDGEPSRGLKKCWEPLLKEGYTWEDFQKVLTAEYVYAEDGLEKMAPLLGIGAGGQDGDGNGQDTVNLYFQKGKRMPSLNTVFKQVFGEGLKEHGFVKIKGKQPYLVRVIGDEIIHVIACKNEGADGEPGYRQFSVWGGVATVYRLSIDLACSPGDNTGWLLTPFYCYSTLHRCTDDFDAEYCMSIYEFSYQKDDGDDLLKKMKNALEVMGREMLPELDKITDLDACIDYFRVFHGSVLNVPVYNEEQDDFGQDDENEGLLYIQADNHDNLVEKYKRFFEELDWKEKKGIKLMWSYEKERRGLESWRAGTVRSRDEIYNNPEIYRKALAELARRKKKNQETLRSYGLEV